MWEGGRISVVLPTYREKDSIGRVVASLLQMGEVDELVVVDNNAEEGTQEEVLESCLGCEDRVVIVSEPRQGYGYSCRCGLAAATGDYLILMEPDGTFLPGDIHKLLAYAEFDAVFGSRTRGPFIREGAKMDLILRVGNWGVAKIVQLLFNGPSITDVGCTLRLISRSLYEEIAPHFTVGGNHFSPEMMVLVFLRRNGYRSVEVPVHFLPRVGESQGTPTLWSAIAVGLGMLRVIFRYRLFGH
jgi:glycosyltransferase involved in cell wall biosynthesis